MDNENPILFGSDGWYDALTGERLSPTRLGRKNMERASKKEATMRVIKRDRLQKQAFNKVVEEFKAIPQVSAIYDGVDRVWVFTSNPKYDDALMDKLLDVEHRYIDSPDWLYTEFRYVADALVEEPDDVVRGTPALWIRSE